MENLTVTVIHFICTELISTDGILMFIGAFVGFALLGQLLNGSKI